MAQRAKITALFILFVEFIFVITYAVSQEVCPDRFPWGYFWSSKIKMSKKLQPKTTKMDFVDIVQDSDNIRAVIISDLHIGRRDSVANDISKTFQKVLELVEREKPNMILIIGDIIHVKLYHIPSSWTDFYDKLETIGIPIHIIPGNHDRYMHGLVKMSFNERNVHLHNVGMIRLFSDPSLPPLILGHDLYNDKRIHGKLIARQWFQMLREVYSRLIPAESIMVLGHLHDIEHSEDNLSFTVGPFSANIGCFHYGVATINDEKKFQVEFKFLDETSMENLRRHYPKYYLQNDGIE